MTTANGEVNRTYIGNAKYVLKVSSIEITFWKDTPNIIWVLTLFLKDASFDVLQEHHCGSQVKCSCFLSKTYATWSSNKLKTVCTSTAKV